MAKAPSPAPKPRLRVAIYTRKSTEEGLDQDFNSLAAQREACDAYIRSQRHEGWIAVPDIYDDGAYSGGNMERPALKALLAEVSADRVDVIVVYKVDRLTRSLSDFAKIVDVLDAAGASFVSVTQSFNTTTSMGRLTLNVLLSFAQFEREVTGERIRDKIAQSKARGMWMGGNVPLGYDVQDRKLIINAAEAESVRFIFRRYLELGSGHSLVDELRQLGIRSKARQRCTGRNYGNQPIERGGLYVILQNRLYVGEVTHKGASYPGQHEAIIERDLFDAVQAQLATGRIEQRRRTRAGHPSLLTGLLFDAHGRRLTPIHASKGGQRYRYYVSATAGTNRSDSPVRIGAHDIEAAVLAELGRTIERAAREAVASGELDSTSIANLKASSARLRDELAFSSGGDQQSLIQQHVQRIEVGADHLCMTIDLSGLGGGFVDPVLVRCPLLIAHTRQGQRLVIPGTDESIRRDESLIRFVAQACDARAALDASAGTPLDKLATELGYGRDYLMTLLRVSYLAPPIVRAILNGRQPPALTRIKLSKTSLPLDWDEQRQVLGFA